jgi:hypothetical protein
MHVLENSYRLGLGSHGVGRKTVAGFRFGEEEDEVGVFALDP